MPKPKLTKTGIPYLDFAWNVTSGCSWAGAGCDNCYAKDLHDKRHKALKAGKAMPSCYGEPFSTIQLHEDRLQAVLTRRKPAVIGVCFMSDLFHPGVPSRFIDQVFAIMARCHQHRFVILTKRPKRMKQYIEGLFACARAEHSARAERKVPYDDDCVNVMLSHYSNLDVDRKWPLSNVMFGTTVWDQASADENIPHLLHTPAAARFVSYEPAVGLANLNQIDTEGGVYHALNGRVSVEGRGMAECAGLDWVVMGCEKLAGNNPGRPMEWDWAADVIIQCGKAKVPFYLKQLDVNGRVAENEFQGSGGLDCPDFFNLGGA